MKKLFQNKNFLLFTLILMASCLGILGVGGKGEAASCDNSYCMRGFPTACKTANQWCIRGGLRNPSCSPRTECWFNAPFDCTEPQTLCLKYSATSYQWTCNSSWGTCDCAELKQVSTCDNQCCKDINSSYSCVNGKCQAVSTAPSCKEACAAESTTFSKCSNETCNNRCINMGGNYFCRYDCIAKSGTTCKNTCICYDSESCDPCDATTCTVTGCEKTITGCDCHYGNWQNTGKCGSDGGCSNNNQMLQTRTKNPTAECGVNDCKEITQCIIHSDCETTTPNPCYWINIGCNPNDECDNQEAEICGPSSCKGNCDGKSKGSTRCVSGSDCNEGGSGVVNNGDPSGEKPPPGGAVRFTNPLSTNSFEALIMGIINWILGIVVSLAILFLIIGGLMYIVSAGDEERIKKAKNIILYSVIGLGVVILSWSIITELKDILGVR